MHKSLAAFLPRVVYSPLLDGWYVVMGANWTPLGGRHETEADAIAWLNNRRNS